MRYSQNYLLWLMRQPAGRVPVEILVGAVECIITIVRNQALRHTVITAEIIDAMCASFEVHMYMFDLNILIFYIHAEWR